MADATKGFVIKMTAVASRGLSDDGDHEVCVNHRLSSILEEDYPQHLQPEESYLLSPCQ